MSMRVLIVDDEPALRSLLERFLTKLGYEAEAVGSAEELAAADPLRFDLFLIDINLPGASGTLLADTLHLRNPWAGILLTSGQPFVAERLHSNTRADARIGFLQKPFPPQALADALERLSRCQAELSKR